jgi:proline-specific peptidase
MRPDLPVETGSVPTPDGELAFRRINPGVGVPLLVVHGGPGAGSRYLRRLERMGHHGEVVFYDQLGCGASFCADSPTLWTIARFAEEISLIRRHLGLDEVHLLGHSSGGWIAMHYLSARPAGVRSVVLANTTASIEQFTAGVNQRISELHDDDRKVIAHFASDPWSIDDSYRDALCEFYVRHIVATRDQAVSLLDAQRASPAYRAMLGPHELAVTGNLAGWDRRADLASVTSPALVIACGRDHVLPDAGRALYEELPAGELVEFEHCGHDPFNESTDETLDALTDFLGCYS